MTEKKRKQSNDNLRHKKSKTGPHLPSSLKKQIQRLNPTNADFDEVDIDFYEYDEQHAEEESMKNKRYDPVSANDCIPSNFEDEYIQSDDEIEIEDNGDGYIGAKRDENALSDDSGEEDEGRHVRMIQGITGMPTEAFQENKKLMMSDALIQELYPESESDPSCEVVGGDGHITIEDLLNPNHVDYDEQKKRMQSIEENARTMHVPLQEADQAKVDRKVAYDISKKHVTKFQPTIQRNREAPTVSFVEKVDIGFSTIGAIASDFTPRTKFEREIAALVHNDKLLEAHQNDGARLFEMNKVSKEDVKDDTKKNKEDGKERQNRMAKLRSLLFCNEKKARRIKKIKSGTFHRLLKKDRLKAESSRIEMDSEFSKKYAMKQYLKRAEERMTLRHTNRSQWAKHVKQHGLNHKYEETRAALDEHCLRHNDLTRKMHSMKGSSSSDDSNDEDDDENSAGSDQDRDIKILEKLMKVLEEKDEIPESGLLSLGFMRRGLKKSREAVTEECEDLLKNLENFGGSEDRKAASTSGRRFFAGRAKAHVRQVIKHTEGSDTNSEGEMVDGIRNSTSKPSYELPSQEELIRHTFAGDDVEAEFQKDKQQILNEENPEPEKPVLLLGWGQWTDTQQKKGLPSGLLKQHKDALRRRDETLKKRNDAQLKNVIISEKSSKKTEKLYTKVLPYPHTSKEAFEHSMRMPIGPESNPTTATGLLNQPEVVKRPGVIIKPIRV